MGDSTIQLRQRRLRMARRRRAAMPRWVLIAAGLVAGLWSASCWAPNSAPEPPAASGNVLAAPAMAEPAPIAPAAGGPGPISVQAVVARPTAVPPVQPPVPPAAMLAPDPAASARVIKAVRANLATRWLKNHRETDLRGGPTEQDQLFTNLPQWSTLKQLEVRGEWTLVYYGGDGATRMAGTGWVRIADVGAVDTPAEWLAVSQPAVLWAQAQTSATDRVAELPTGARLEVAGTDQIMGSRIKVRVPGDGRTVSPGEGWVEAGAALLTTAPPASRIPWSYPAILKADVRLKVPYRSQLDGKPYAGANCGPTTLGMGLEFLGINVEQRTLRTMVLLAQGGTAEDDENGSFIWAMTDAARAYGARPLGLYAPDGQTLRRWSVDDIRAEVRQGRPVIAQVRFRALPGRSESLYYGDHYVIVTGLMGDRLIYNDSIDSDGAGWDRIMSAQQLEVAMNASDRPYAYSAFALSR